MITGLVLQALGDASGIEVQVAAVLGDRYCMKVQSMGGKRILSVWDDYYGSKCLELYISHWKTFACEVYAQGKPHDFVIGNVWLLQPKVPAGYTALWVSIYLKLLSTYGGYFTAIGNISEIYKYYEGIQFATAWSQASRHSSNLQILETVEKLELYNHSVDTKFLEETYTSRSARGWIYKDSDESKPKKSLVPQASQEDVVGVYSWLDLFKKMGGVIEISDIDKYPQAVETWRRCSSPLKK